MTYHNSRYDARHRSRLESQIHLHKDALFPLDHRTKDIYIASPSRMSLAGTVIGDIRDGTLGKDVQTFTCPRAGNTSEILS